MTAQRVGKTVSISVNHSPAWEVPAEETLLSSLTEAGILLDASCGGQGTCGKCRIKLLSGQVVDRLRYPAQPMEDGRYLACQVYPAEDLVLEIPVPGQAQVSAKGEIGDQFLEDFDLSPPIRKILLRPVYPTLEHNYSLQEMIRQGTRANEDREEGISLEISALQDLARIAPEKPEEITLLRTSDQITALEAGDTWASLYGAAFDIGSTTVAGMLVDLNNGKVIAAAAETNPQAAYGADVISRIKAARTEAGLKALTSAVRKSLNDILAKLCTAAGIFNQEIYWVTAAGNSTMEHLLMGVSPEYLTISPYVPVFKDLPLLPPRAIDLAINAGGKVQLLPNIASFVGGDTVAAILGVDQDLTAKLTLLIDLGTNGEIVLGNKDKLLVSSMAAGPAFEGAQLSSGMRAAIGAIDKIAISDDVYVHTIEDEPARGICGSGVIQGIAELLKAGVITPSGRFAGKEQQTLLPGELGRRLKAEKGQKEFVLVPARHSGTGRDISITQGDIREIQLVKSSIFTGVEILMENYGITFADIEKVLIAGAFGNHLDLDSALGIGLVPSALRGKVIPVGNAAGTGAVKALLSEPIRERCRSIVNKARFIELANHPGFQKKFINNLSFPEGNE